MQTKMKILGLVALSLGYVTFAACGGGGGGSDGKGNSVNAEANCHQTKIVCSNGKESDATGNASCPFMCGQAEATVNTNSATGTGRISN